MSGQICHQYQSSTLAGLDPKQIIDHAIRPVARQLAALDPHLVQLLDVSTKTSEQIVHHVFSAGGKRIRPAMYFLSSQLVQYKGDQLIPMAAVCEFVHTASLLHDDVIDNSILRRGKKTANSIWGDESAVLVGDLIYAKASELMAKTGSLEIVAMFAQAIRLMSEGELLQLEHVFNPEMPLAAYYKIIEHKTAVLLSASCCAPAILANHDASCRRALSEFGRCVGFAFQLLDDALDYAGTEDLFGKKTLSDLPEGKVTLPILLLREVASAADWEYVKSKIQSQDLTQSTMLTILQMVDHHDTAGLALEKASHWTDCALKELNHFPESEARSQMENLARGLLMRFS